MDKKKIFLLSSLGLLSLLWLSFRQSKYRTVNVIRKVSRQGTWPKRDLSGITDITVHHAASSDSATWEDFNRWHKNEKGWPSIGYHTVIYQDGTRYIVNPLDSYTYHNGFNNKVAIGVCLVGNFDVNKPNQVQLDSLVSYVKELKKDKKLSSLRRLIGHKEYANTTACPGRYFPTENIRAQTKMKGLSSGAFGLVSNISLYNYEEADN